ncbi:MAG: DUF4836 family protein [Saprospiraceae bacterium]
MEAYICSIQQNKYLEEKGSALIWNDQLGILGMGDKDDVRTQTQNYLELEEEQSILNNKDFRNAIAEDYDVFNWMSSSALVDLYELAELTKLTPYTEEDLRANYLHSYLHFEDDEIRAETQGDGDLV